MTAIVVPNYPLDLTSTDPRNRITNERHTFVTDTDRIFVPSAGPFYVSSFVIRNATTGAFLKPTIDYKLLHPDIDAIHESGLHVCCVVFVVNDAISSVSIDYQVIGGQYSDLIPVVRELLANTDTIQPTINWYTQVYAKPDSYPPAPHWHTGNDFSEWDRIALRLDEIMSALVYKDRYSWQSAYDYVDRIVKLASDSLRADLDMTQQFNNVYSKSQATELFLSKVDAAATYLSKADATATYLSKADASSTYLTKSNASTTYATRDDLTSANNSLTTLINNVATDLNQNYIKKTDADTVNSLISSTNSTILTMINERTKVSPDSGNALVKRGNGFYVPVSAQSDLSGYATKTDLVPYAKKTDVSTTISEFTYDKNTIDNKIGNVTVDITELLKDPRFQQYKVGDVLTTTHNYANGAEVAAAVGYGTWTKYAKGRVIIGESDGPVADDAGNTQSFTLGQIGGEFKHTLTIAEIPPHKHTVADTIGIDGQGGGWDLNSNTNNFVESKGMGLTGGGQAHNNIQPYVVGQHWLRVPDSFKEVTYDLYFTSDAAGNNRVTVINEGQDIYLWVAVANSTQGVRVEGVQYPDTGIMDITGSISVATTLSNGNNRLLVLRGTDYTVASTVPVYFAVKLLDIMTVMSTVVYNTIGVTNVVAEPTAPTAPTEPTTPTDIIYSPSAVPVTLRQTYQIDRISDGYPRVISAADRSDQLYSTSTLAAYVNDQYKSGWLIYKVNNDIVYGQAGSLSFTEPGNGVAGSLNWKANGEMYTLYNYGYVPLNTAYDSSQGGGNYGNYLTAVELTFKGHGGYVTKVFYVEFVYDARYNDL